MESREHGGPVWVGNYALDRLDEQPETVHTEHTISYCVSGGLEMVHGELIEIGPGAITVVPAGAPHQGLGGGPVELWNLSFCATCLSLDEGQALMSPFRRARLGALPFGVVEPARRDAVVARFAELSDECRRTPAELEIVRALLVLILRDVRAAMPIDDAVAPEGSLVADALLFIQKHCLEPISLKDVAAAIGKAPAHVAATVKKATGYSVGQWIADGRLNEACVRLAHTDDTVEEVGYRVGWNDATHFIRQFKKAFGVTPAQWRKDNRRAHGVRSDSHETGVDRLRDA